MFSDFNQDAETLQRYPFLEGYLENNHGENLESFGFMGEATDADKGLKNSVPSWLKGTKIEEIENKKTKMANDYIDGLTRNDYEVLKKKKWGKMNSEQMFRDPAYLKILNVMRNDVGEDMGANDIEYFLKTPATNWEADFFNSQRDPSKQEVEDLLIEAERPQPRKYGYETTMNDLWSIYSAMSSSVLTEPDLKKRDTVSKLIAERELLFRRETMWIGSLEDFKQLYFEKMDREYIALPVPSKIQKAFLNLFKKLRYNKIVFEGEHRKVQKDLIGLKVDHFLPKKTSSTLLLTAQNTLNYGLTSKNIGKKFI